MLGAYHHEMKAETSLVELLWISFRIISFQEFQVAFQVPRPNQRTATDSMLHCGSQVYRRRRLLRFHASSPRQLTTRCRSPHTAVESKYKHGSRRVIRDMEKHGICKRHTSTSSATLREKRGNVIRDIEGKA